MVARDSTLKHRDMAVTRRAAQPGPAHGKKTPRKHRKHGSRQCCAHSRNRKFGWQRSMRQSRNVNKADARKEREGHRKLSHRNGRCLLQDARATSRGGQGRESCPSRTGRGAIMPDGVNADTAGETQMRGRERNTTRAMRRDAQGGRGRRGGLGGR